ncbi:high affinity immunoglobulin gamma Fc receptor I-like [Anguilla anguilla]|uniref:high affinity immunoglobulin gamma Fc receptor I-like n=1 Tax=Anguilla anguilla TaxID=7936 RepID=UPI0015ACD2F8|nr:high affinity immunoglobulin gamma Fc receptor I-like [Anguilla anguilla]
MQANRGVTLILLSLMTRLGSPKPVLTLQPNWPLFFTGETVTLSCLGWPDIRTGFTWSKFELNSWTLKHTSHENTYTISSVTVAHGGAYRCADSSSHSDDVRLTVSNKPQPVLTAPPHRQLYAGESVSLSCEVTGTSAGWKYYWYKGTGPHDIAHIARTAKGLYTLSAAALTHTGEYSCRAGRGDPVWYTEYSCPAYIQVIAPPKATLTVQPKWRPLYPGDTVTLMCWVDPYGNWTYFWYKNQPQTAIFFTKEYAVTITGAAGSDRGPYWCEGRLEGRNVTSQPSDSITLTVGRLVFGLGAAPLLLASIILCVKWCRKPVLPFPRTASLQYGQPDGQFLIDQSILQIGSERLLSIKSMR